MTQGARPPLCGRNRSQLQCRHSILSILAPTTHLVLEPQPGCGSQYVKCESHSRGIWDTVPIMGVHSPWTTELTVRAFRSCSLSC